MKSLLLSALMLAGTAMFAQAQQQPNDNGRQMETLTGCLTKSATNGEYVLSDQNSGQKYTFRGPQRLDNYINHTVQMNGTMVNDQNGQKQFQPQSVKTVSDTCKAQQ